MRQQDTFDETALKKRFAWYRKPIYWLGVLLSVLWLFLAADYFIGTGWWSSRYRLVPAEFMGLVLSQLVPLALIWFVVAWIERRDQLRQETQTLRRYMNQLMYPTEEGAVYTKSLTDALRAQIREFKKVFAEVADQTNGVRDDLKLWIKDLATVIDHVDTQTLASIKEMAHHVQVLAKSTQKANESTRGITEDLSERAMVLQATSEKVARTLGGVAGVLTENMKSIDRVTDTLKDAAQKTQQIVTAADGTAVHFQTHMDRLEGILSQYETQTQTYNDRLFANAEKILTILKTQGTLLDQEVEKTLHKLTGAAEQAAEHTQAVFQLSDQAIRHLGDVGAQFATQADLMGEALGSVDAKLHELGTLGLEKQAEKLMEVSRSTETYLKELKADLASTQTDQFMKDARLILEHLSLFSIDIVHVFTPKAEEEQWKKYYAGDNGAFMRYLMTALPKDKMDKFKALYQENNAVRVAVTRYLSEFDALAQKAKNNEKKDVLLPVLIGSDAGRLYMILKQALGKKGGAA